MYVCPSVGQIVPGSNTPILGSNNPPITGLLFIYVSREVTSTTEFFRISSADNILNWIPMIFEVTTRSLVTDFDMVL